MRKPTKINGEIWLTTSDASAVLGVSAERVRQYCRAGRLGQRIGRNYLIRQSDARKFSPLPTGRPPKVLSQQ
jgi:hypothetical protein